MVMPYLPSVRRLPSWERNVHSSTLRHRGAMLQAVTRAPLSRETLAKVRVRLPSIFASARILDSAAKARPLPVINGAAATVAGAVVIVAAAAALEAAAGLAM